jgi:hypothetical protein
MIASLVYITEYLGYITEIFGNIEASAECILATGEGRRKSVDQVRSLKQVREMPRRGVLHLEVGTQVWHVEQAAIVYAQIEKRVLQGRAHDAPRTTRSRRISVTSQ